FQLVTPDLQSEYPPLKSLDAGYLEPVMGKRAQNPYKGLRAFSEQDADDFFGREALTERLLERLREDSPFRRFLAIVGPSGSGKSSVARAGLIPELRKGALTGSESWQLAKLVPGAHPLEELEAALLRVAVNPPPSLLEQLQDERGLVRAVKRTLPEGSAVELVLLVDQFEEAFTLAPDEVERARFLEGLCSVATDPRSRAWVICTLRADFYDRPLLYPDVGEMLRQRTEVVLPLSTSELHRAIVEPARRAGVELEPDLVSTIIHDVEEQPGALPLLQYALTELFERREGSLLTLQAYRESGGVQGALSRRAEELYEGLTGAEQEIARQVFLRLVTLGEGVEHTRRRVSLSELRTLGADEDTLVGVLELFGQYRLLTFDREPMTGEPTVEMAHEALIRSWPRLGSWLEDSREALRTQRRLLAETAEWLRADRDPSYLASGTRLVQYEGLSDGALALSSEEREYVAASVVARDQSQLEEHQRQEHELELARERELAQRQAAHRLRYLVAAMAVFLVVVAALAALALVSRSRAVASFNQSESQRLAAESSGVLQRGESAELAALLALRGLRAQYSPQVDMSLQRASRYDYGARLFQAPDVVMRAGVSTDERYLVGAGSSSGELTVWDFRTGKVLRSLHGKVAAEMLSVSPDGRYALSGSGVPPNEVTLWDLRSGRALWEHTGRGAAARFEADSVSICCEDGAVVVREIGSGRELRRRQLAGESNLLFSAAFSPDGHRVLTGNQDGTMALWDATTGVKLREYAGHTANVWSLAISQDGRSALSGSWDKSVRLWDLDSGKNTRTFLGHTDVVFGVAISPDGRYAASGSLDTTARVWDTHTGAELRKITGHTASVYGVTFTPEGMLLTASKDHTVRLWNLHSPLERDTLTGHTGAMYYPRFSPDGRYLATTSFDHTARIWNATTDALLHTLNHPQAVRDAVYSPDGRYLLTECMDGVARLWDVRTGKQVRAYDTHEPGTFGDVAYSPDGRRIAVSTPSRVQVLEVQTGDVVREWSAGLGVLAFSPDGKSLLVGSDSPQKAAWIWDINSGRELQHFQQDTEVTGVA
ncbi:MAG: hypothetical protein M3281_02260, partial [Chloroflexota bacterium]|nr:hypothetical protein [Chloroflexota bacterium]